MLRFWPEGQKTDSRSAPRNSAAATGQMLFGSGSSIPKTGFHEQMEAYMSMPAEQRVAKLAELQAALAEQEAEHNKVLQQLEAGFKESQERLGTLQATTAQQITLLGAAVKDDGERAKLAELTAALAKGEAAHDANLSHLQSTFKESQEKLDKVRQAAAPQMKLLLAADFGTTKPPSVTPPLPANSPPKAIAATGGCERSPPASPQ